MPSFSKFHTKLFTGQKYIHSVLDKCRYFYVRFIIYLYWLEELRVQDVAISILRCGPTDRIDLLLLVMMCIYF
jgi:hypothetical protein